MYQTDLRRARLFRVSPDFACPPWGPLISRMLKNPFSPRLLKKVEMQGGGPGTHPQDGCRCEAYLVRTPQIGLFQQPVRRSCVVSGIQFTGETTRRGYLSARAERVRQGSFRIREASTSLVKEYRPTRRSRWNRPEIWARSPGAIAGFPHENTFRDVPVSSERRNVK